MYICRTNIQGIFKSLWLHLWELWHSESEDWFFRSGLRMDPGLSSRYHLENLRHINKLSMVHCGDMSTGCSFLAFSCSRVMT